jgi:hypothetical protein
MKTAPIATFNGKEIHSLLRASCVFRIIVTGRFGIVTTEFGNVTGHFGDVTEAVLVAA